METIFSYGTGAPNILTGSRCPCSELSAIDRDKSAPVLGFTKTAAAAWGQTTAPAEINDNSDTVPPRGAQNTL